MTEVAAGSWPLEERLRSLVEASVDYAIFALEPDGRVATWNPGAERIKGYTAEEIIGRHFSVFYPPEAIRSGLPDRELRIASAEGRYAEEGWRLRKDGSRLWASVTITALHDTDGALRGFGKVTRDLTQEKAAHDALRLAEEQFRYAFDAAPIGMALMSLNGRWLRVNDALCRLTGWSREQLLTSTLQRLLEPSDPGAGLQHVQDLLVGEEIGTGTDTRIVRRDGVPIWVQLNVGVVRDADGRPRHLVTQIEDISGRIAATEAQHAAVAQLAAANSALQDAEQTKAHFLAVASHELRSPLTAIIGYADILDRRWDGVPEERKREAVRTIVRQGRRLQLLVEDLLTLSSIEADGLTLTRREIRLRELLDEVAATTGQPLSLEGDVDRTVDADPLRLSQILTNLAVNATKYGEPPYVLSVTSVPGAVEIRVCDHGEGVPAQFVPRLFERFTQADEGLRRRSHGVGLGLAICRALADAHGATLSYETPEGGGACFMLSLPQPA